MIAAVPFVKSAGGKRQLLPELMARAPPKFADYHEPFLGGGALFFALQAEGRGSGQAWLSDSCSPLICAFAGVRDHLPQTMRALQRTRVNEASYYAARDRKPRSVSAKAAWFIFINKAGFNGLWRVNKAGKCNVPWGGREGATLFDRANLTAASAALQHATVCLNDFRLSLKSVEESDFVYLDPPYVPASKSASFTAYTAGDFTDADQVALRDEFARLRSAGVRALLSNSDTPRVRELYAGFPIDRVTARRNINCDGDKRGRVGELLVQTHRWNLAPEGRRARVLVDGADVVNR